RIKAAATPLDLDPCVAFGEVNEPTMCPACGQPMQPGVGCTVAYLSEHRRVPYGSEDEDWGVASGTPCHDCNVLPGQLHHWACDVARCADGGGQEHEGPWDPGGWGGLGCARARSW